MQTIHLARFIALARTVPELDTAAQAIADAAGLPEPHYRTVRLRPAYPDRYTDDRDISGGAHHVVTGWAAEYAVTTQEGK